MKMPCKVFGWEQPLHRRPHPVMRTYGGTIMSKLVLDVIVTVGQCDSLDLIQL